MILTHKQIIISFKPFVTFSRKFKKALLYISKEIIGDKEREDKAGGDK